MFSNPFSNPFSDLSVNQQKQKQKYIKNDVHNTNNQSDDTDYFRVSGNVVNEVQGNCRIQKNGEILCKKCSRKWNQTEFTHHQCQPLTIHCKICNQYIKSFSYQQHKVRHENLRLHKCEICHTGFNQSGHLLTHMEQVHNDQKVYICEICGKGSKTPWLYRSHLKVKHEDKSYSCPHCHYLFSSKGNLETHILAVHDRLRYPCWLCFEKFAASEIVETQMISELCKTTPLTVTIIEENDSLLESKRKRYLVVNDEITDEKQSKKVKSNEEKENEEERKLEGNNDIYNSYVLCQEINQSTNVQQVIHQSENGVKATLTMKKSKSVHARYIFINDYQLNCHKIIFHPGSDEVSSILDFKEKHGRWPKGDITGISNDEKKLGRMLYKIVVNKTYSNFEKCVKSVTAIVEECKQNMSILLLTITDNEIEEMLSNYDHDWKEAMNKK